MKGQIDVRFRDRAIKSWLLIGILVGGAFLSGSRLRSWEGTATPAGGAKTYALLKLTPEWSPTTPPEPAKASSEDKELVGSVLSLLKAHYVEPITPEKEKLLARGAVRGMLNELADPDSRFLDPEERKLLDDAGTGTFHGIGAVLSLKNEKVGDLDVTKVVVVAPMPGSPAEAGGLKPGDSITHIDDKWIVTHDPFKEAHLEAMLKSVRNKEIDEFTYQKAYDAAYKKLKEGVQISDALETLTAKSSGEVRIQVERTGEKPIKVKLRCQKTTVSPVVYKELKGNIAYIRVSQFNKRSVQQFATKLGEARKRKAPALILDIRNNPGGLMESAIDVVGKITGGGPVAIVQEREGGSTKVRTLRAPRSTKVDIPVMVLVNGGTASVAEMVAGALRDSGKATLVGTKTYGDGLLQTPLMLRDGSAAVVTTGKMLTPKGTDFEGKGIQPDKVLAEDDSRGDAQLEEATKLLLAKLGKA